MTIDRQKGEIIVMCDGEGCLEYLDVTTTEWTEVMATLRRERWRSSKATGAWRHYCPGCASEIEE